MRELVMLVLLSCLFTHAHPIITIRFYGSNHLDCKAGLFMYTEVNDPNYDHEYRGLGEAKAFHLVVVCRRVSL